MAQQSALVHRNGLAPNEHVPEEEHLLPAEVASYREVKGPVPHLRQHLCLEPDSTAALKPGFWATGMWG